MIRFIVTPGRLICFCLLLWGFLLSNRPMIMSAVVLMLLTAVIDTCVYFVRRGRRQRRNRG